MTAEIEQDENANTIAKELLEHGLIHEVINPFSLQLRIIFFRAITHALNNQLIEH